MKRRIFITFFFVVILSSGYAIYNSLDDKIVFVPEYQNRHQILLNKIPKDLSFAGEEVELKTPDAYRKIEREMKINAANNSSSRLLLKNVRIWLPQIAEVLKANKIPEDFKYVAVAESNLTNAVSGKGAAGFWQLTQETALELGLEVNDEVDERYHPVKSTNAACKYFKRAHKRFGNWTATAASYNRGINGLERAFKKQNVNSYYDLALNDETSRYIFRVMAVKDLINNPKKYKMKVRKYKPRHTKKVKVTKNITDLTAFAKSHHITYEDLTEYNPWLLKNTLTIKEKGSSYTLFIPKK